MSPPPPMCPRYQAAVELLGKRWTGLLLRVLMSGPQRFGELSSAVPDMSERLKELESEDVLVRTVLPGPPVRVEYALSEKGRALSGVVEEIGRWAEKWITVPGQSHAPHSLSVKPARAR